MAVLRLTISPIETLKVVEVVGVRIRWTILRDKRDEGSLPSYLHFSFSCMELAY